jgi:PAS domain S-box-containing protein
MTQREMKAKGQGGGVGRVLNPGGERIAAILRSIIEGTSASAGEEYLHSLVRNLATTLGFRYALVGEAIDGRIGRVRTLAFWSNGGFVENIEYDLDGTPCNEVIGKELCLYPSGVQRHFPKDKDLVAMDVECYIGVPLFDQAGRPLGIMNAMDSAPMEDWSLISSIFAIFAQRAAFELERERLDDERRKSTGMLSAIMDNSPALIRMRYVDGRYIFINRKTEVIFGINREEVVGKTVYDFFPKELAEQWVANDKLVLEANSPLEIEEEIIHPDGTQHTYISIKFPIPSLPGAVCSISTDITGRKKTEEELMKAQKLESIGALAGGIAHDFNNILLGVLGNASIAKTHVKPGEKVFELLNDIEAAARHAKGIAKQLLTFSSGGEPVMDVVSIVELIRDTATLVLKGTGVECDYGFAEDLRDVDIDEVQVSQVINNIILNALHAMPEGGRMSIGADNITVTAQDALPLEDGDYVRITIKDRGKGIPKKNLPKIFDPFFTTKEKASGLGLALSYSVIKKHKGHISVESKMGSGTIFSIYLPACQKEQLESNYLQGGGDKMKGKVLVMDDEAVVRDVSGEMLELLGYGVEFALDGMEALKKYKEAMDTGEPFRMVIMDLTVPGGMGGKETITELLAMDPDAKAIVSSGYSRDPVMANFKEYGFKGIIAKPYTMKEFRVVLRDILKDPD